jgi:tRNA threonylcarbamoyladenosine biosynthesis protein TsaE
MSYHTLTSIDDTKRFANELAASLVPGTTLGFSGPLGAGKTTLIRFIVEALGSTDPVSSPSYVLEHQYSYPQGKIQGIIQHWDLYRVAELPNELLEPPPANAVRLIEWADKFAEIWCGEGLGCMVKMEVMDGLKEGRGEERRVSLHP